MIDIPEVVSWEARDGLEFVQALIFFLHGLTPLPLLS